MKKEITWTTGDGRTVNVSVELQTEKEVWIDEVVTVACCEINIIAEVNGEIIGTGRPVKANHPVAVARIGNLGISSANLANINSAIAEVEATPEWQNKLRGIAAAEKEATEYDKHRAMMHKVMGY